MSGIPDGTQLKLGQLVLYSIICVLQEYRCLTQRPECPAQVWVFLACVFFFLGLYSEAEEAASKGTCTTEGNQSFIRT